MTAMHKNPEPSLVGVAGVILIAILAGYLWDLSGALAGLVGVVGFFAARALFEWFHSRNSDEPDSQSDLDRFNSREQEVRALVKEGLLSESDGLDESRANSREQLEGEPDQISPVKEPDQPESPGGNFWFVKELWEGNVPLWKTYWLFMWLGNNLFNLVLLYMITNPSFYSSVQIVSVMQFAYLAFMWVAVWRSSGKYKGPSIYKYLARITVVFGAFVALGNVAV